MNYEPHSSSFSGISANIVALVCVVVSPFFGIVGLLLGVMALFIEKNSGMVKYYASLGLVLWLLRTILNAAVSLIEGIYHAGQTFIGSYMRFFYWGGNLALSILSLAVFLLVAGCAAYAAYSAYRWKAWRVPVLGTFAEWLAAKAPPACYNGQGPVPSGCEQKTRPEDAQKQDGEGAQTPRSAQNPEGAQHPQGFQSPQGAPPPQGATTHEGAQHPQGFQSPQGAHPPQGDHSPNNPPG